MKKTTEHTATDVIADTAAEAITLLHAVSAEQVADAIKIAGCSVTTLEHNGVPHLHSASQGVGFQVLWGNAAATSGQFVDFTLSCPLRVQDGVLPEGLIAEWHRSKRFARIVQHGDLLALEMDVIVVGGVSTAHLNMMVQLWTQMMGQFFLHLRNFAPAAPVAGTPTVGSNQEAVPATAAPQEASAVV